MPPRLSSPLPIHLATARSLVRRRALQFAAVCLAMLSGCSRSDPAGRERIVERDQLRREVAGLKSLENLAPGQVMDRRREVMVSVRDTLLQSLLTAALPVSVNIRNDLTVTMTEATVTFRSNVARVAIIGHVRRRTFPRVAAVVRLRGALDRFVVDSAQALRARIAIDDVELDAPSGGLSALDPLLIDVLQSILERSLPELTSGIPPVTIPVRLDQSMTLPGFGPEGAFTIAPSAAPLRVQASRVIAFQNRLWIVLKVELGEFATIGRESAGGSDSVSTRDTATSDTTR